LKRIFQNSVHLCTHFAGIKMKFEKRTNQFKIRVSDDFVKVVKAMCDQRGISQSDIIHIALAEYARRSVRDYNKIKTEIESVEDTRNTQVKRRTKRKF
jgi:hypothetical protein